MSANSKFIAGIFAVGGCFIMVSLIFAISAAFSLVAYRFDYFIEFLVVSASTARIGFYNAYRAIQETIREN